MEQKVQAEKVQGVVLMCYREDYQQAVGEENG